MAWTWLTLRSRACSSHSTRWGAPSFLSPPDSTLQHPLAALQVQKLNEDMLHAVHEAVKTCVKLFDKTAAAQIILLVVEALIASDEGSEASSLIGLT